MTPKASVRSARALRQAGVERRTRLESLGWSFMDEVRIDGRLPLTVGRMFRVSGIRGWFKFTSAAQRPDGHVEITCHGPCTKAGRVIQTNSRCFDAARVTRVARSVD